MSRNSSEKISTLPDAPTGVVVTKNGVDLYMASIKEQVGNVIHTQNFHWDVKLSEQYSALVIEAILYKKPLTLEYRVPEDNPERKLSKSMIRQVLPLALYKKVTIPGEEIYSRWLKRNIKTDRPYHHLKLDLYQIQGFSETQQEGFKTLNLEEISSMRMAACLSEEDDFTAIEQWFKLNTYTNAHYIAQFGQLRVEQYRDEFLRILAKK